MTDESGRARDGNGYARNAGARRTHDRCALTPVSMSRSYLPYQ
jgi:hypothetical protein